jgi:hypothetical protein
MSVDTIHPDYSRVSNMWTRCRDVIQGRDRLNEVDKRSANGVYLQKPTGLSEAEFHAYCDRASFFNASARTKEAITGLILAKPANFDYPIEEHLNDVTNTGIKLREFAQSVIDDEVEITRTGVLVEYPSVDTSQFTKAEVESLNLRPYLVKYSGEQITNWKVGTVNNSQRLTMVTLKESIDSSEDEFSHEEDVQYRVLDISNGVYRIRVFTKNDKDEDEIVSELYPKINGEYLTEIPFYIVGGARVRKPMMNDLIDTNIAHYRNSADFEHALRFTIPTAVVTGAALTPETGEFRIGGLSAWVFQNPDARASYLEFKGDGLRPVKDAIKDKEFRMAILGARMLADEKRASEAVSTVEIRTAGERAIIANTADDVSDTITKALKVMAKWSGKDDSKVKYKLNIDYGIGRLDYHTIKELVASWQADAITSKTLFENLVKGDIISPDETFDDYQDQLLTTAYSVTNEVYSNKEEVNVTKNA